jgi:hypothetical protein
MNEESAEAASKRIRGRLATMYPGLKLPDDLDDEGLQKVMALTTQLNAGELRTYIILSAEARGAYAAMSRKQRISVHEQTKTYSPKELDLFMRVDARCQKVLLRYSQKERKRALEVEVSLPMKRREEMQVYLLGDFAMRETYLRMQVESRVKVVELLEKELLVGVGVGDQDLFAYLRMRPNSRDPYEFMHHDERVKWLAMTEEAREESLLFDETETLVAKLGAYTKPSVRIDALTRLAQLSAIGVRKNRKVMVRTDIVTKLSQLVLHGGKTRLKALAVLKNLLRHASPKASQDVLAILVGASETPANLKALVQAGVVQPLLEVVRGLPDPETGDEGRRQEVEDDGKQAGSDSDEDGGNQEGDGEGDGDSDFSDDDEVSAGGKNKGKGKGKSVVEEQDRFCVLSVRIIRAQGIRAMDKGGTSDPYCTISHGNKRQRKALGLAEEVSRRTEVKKKTVKPKWDETFEIEVPAEARLLPVLVELHDYDRLSRNDFMGQVTLPLRSVPVPKKRGKQSNNDDTADHDANGGEEEVQWYNFTSKLGRTEGQTYGEVQLGLRWQHYINYDEKDLLRLAATARAAEEAAVSSAEAAAAATCEKLLQVATKSVERAGWLRGQAVDANSNAAAWLRMGDEAPRSLCACAKEARNQKSIARRKWHEAAHEAAETKSTALRSLREAEAVHWIEITVLQARRILALDKPKERGQRGTSDAYCKIKVGSQKTVHKSSVQKATLEPWWNETFRATPKANDSEWSPVDLTAPIEVRLFDRDRFALAMSDDFLGAMRVNCAGLQRRKRRRCWHKLLSPDFVDDGVDRGELELEVKWCEGGGGAHLASHTLKQKSLSKRVAKIAAKREALAAAACVQTAARCCSLYTQCKAEAAEAMEQALLATKEADECTQQWREASYTLQVKVLQAKELLPADKGARDKVTRKRVGTSDPYALLTMGKQKSVRTKTIKKTLDPRWYKEDKQGSTFLVKPAWGAKTDVDTSLPLQVEVRDDDLVGSQFLGKVEIPIGGIPHGGEAITAWYKLEAKDPAKELKTLQAEAAKEKEKADKKAGKDPEVEEAGKGKDGEAKEGEVQGGESAQEQEEDVVRNTERGEVQLSLSWRSELGLVRGLMEDCALAQGDEHIAARRANESAILAKTIFRSAQVASVNTLQVRILSAEGLRPMDKDLLADPYVTARVGSGSTWCRTGVVQERSLDPGREAWAALDSAAPTATDAKAAGAQDQGAGGGKGKKEEGQLSATMEMIPAHSDEHASVIADWTLPLQLLIKDFDKTRVLKSGANDDYMGQCSIKLDEYLFKRGEECEVREMLTNKKGHVMEIWTDPRTKEEKAEEGSRGHLTVGLRWLMPKESKIYQKLKAETKRLHAIATELAKQHTQSNSKYMKLQRRLAAAKGAAASYEAAVDCMRLAEEAAYWSSKAAEEEALEKQEAADMAQMAEPGSEEAEEEAEQQRALEAEKELAMRPAVKALKMLLALSAEEANCDPMLEEGTMGPVLELLNGGQCEARALAMQLMKQLWHMKMAVVEEKVVSGERDPKEMKKEKVRRGNGAEVGAVKHHD